MSFFHLITHAFFKAIMFIRVGNLIHSRQLYQSIKNTGVMLYSSPFNRSTVVLARASLCGAPFSAAFFSKEPIIEINIYNSGSLGVITLVMLSLSMTLLYSSRLMKVVLVHFNSITPIVHVSEIDINLRKGVCLLSLPSFTRGASMARLLQLKPTTFLYHLRLKLFIFIGFFIILIIMLASNYPVISAGLVYLFPIWGLRLLSGPLFNSITHHVSFNSKVSGFRAPLKVIQGLGLLKLTRFSGLFGSHLIYRLFVSIPFFFIFYNLMYYKLLYT